MIKTCTIQYFDSKNHIDDYLNNFMIRGLNMMIRRIEIEKNKYGDVE